MNKINRLVWSKIKEKWIVASEKVSCGCRPSSVVGALTLAAFLTLAGTAFSLDPNALPTGGKITAGSGNIAASGNKMTVNQSTQQIIANWDTFNIGQSATVRFNQPNSSATALNRIYDQNPSQIFGNLSANGKIFLLNPSGIVFGANARVDVGGLVASSLNMLDSDYLAGKFMFTNSGAAGSILNQGIINAMPGGVVALIAPRVVNSGTITANSGSVILAAANEASLDFKGDGLINYTISQGAVDALAENKGLIKADGGLVVMTAKAADSITRAVVNNTGVIEAQTLQNKGGRILLLSDMENGDAIIGGTLDASALNGGDGGFVETSGGRVKIGDGTKVTTSAPQGKTGLWLIDPVDFTIVSSGGDITGTALGNALNSADVTIDATGASATCTSTASITCGAGSGSNGDIFVNDAVTWNTNKLTLTAARNIEINAVMKANNAALTMTTGGSGNVNIGMLPNGGGFKGRVDFFQADGTTPRSGTGFLTINGAGYTVITDLGVFNSVTGTDLQGMNSALEGKFALGSNINAGATSEWNDNGSGGFYGFTPIGPWNSRFTGVFDGLGHTISDLTIDRSTSNEQGQGLFGATSLATLSNVGLLNVNITGKNWVGGLVGDNSSGSISNSYATGSLDGSGDNVGGLVGYNNGGTISNSYASVKVTGAGYFVGGLIGSNRSGSISNSYATGEVNGIDNVGGLVGDNSSGSISNSYATGLVNGSGDNVGGLAGQNCASVPGSSSTANASISNSYATGAVNGNDNVGGLVGWNDAYSGDEYSSTNASITNSYATGAVNGSGNRVGGLVGQNYATVVHDSSADASINNSYATGQVTGGDNVGGLVGQNYADGGTSSITNSFWDTQTSVKSTSAGGTGKTTTEMHTLATFTGAGWDIDAAGSTGKVWRIYEGDTYPLLRSFLTPLTIAADNVSKTYDGTAYAGGLDGTVYTPASPVMIHLPNVATAYDTFINASTYTPSIYSDQQGYDITMTGGTLTINPAPVNFTGTRVYDGSTSFAAAKFGTGGTISTGVGTETLILTGAGSVASKTVAAGSQTVTLETLALNNGTGGDKNNYTFTGGTHTATITKLALTGNITADNKVYDGNDVATIATRTLTGAIISDTVSYIGGSATFSDKNVANGKTVTGIDLSLDGTDAGNYTVNPTATTTANITALTTASIFPEIPFQLPPLPPPAKDPSYSPPPPVFDPSDPNSGIVITVVSQPSPGTAGVIIVTIPGTLAEPGAGFSFPLPEQLANAAAAAAIKVTMPDGSPLPSWLQYDPDTRTFVARNVPEGPLSIDILITVGNQSWTVKITK